MTLSRIDPERSWKDRLHNIRVLWKKHQGLYVTTGFLVGLMVGMLLYPFAQAVRNADEPLLPALVPEAIGIVFTVLVIDTLNRRREEQREERQLKERLIREFGSRVNEVAKHAAEQLQLNKWMGDGSLQNVYLPQANLHDAILEYANLNGAMLEFANLEDADLFEAELRGTGLSFARMKGAKLVLADLEGAKLGMPNCTGQTCTMPTLPTLR